MIVLGHHHTQYLLATIASSLGFIILYGLAYLVHRYMRLRHVPGPWLANWTDLWLIYRFRICGQSFVDVALELDRTYGPVVKYGPRRVLFGDVAASTVIYSTSNVFEKADSYDVPVPVINGKLVPTFASLRDEKLASQIRRHLNSKFTTTAVLEYEHHIDQTLTTLCRQLEKSRTCDLASLLVFFTLDTICQLAFSKDSDAMGTGVDPGNTIRGGRERFDHWHRWFSIPYLDHMINKSPLFSRARKVGLIAQVAMQRVKERMTEGQKGGYHDLLDRYIEGHQKNPEVWNVATIIGVTISTIHAGADTTGQTMNSLFWSLFQNPKVYEKLKRECRQANLSSPPQFSEVKKLTYVEACIKESQRLYVMVLNPTERTVPKEGAMIAGVFIPGGSIVALNHHALTLNRAIYGQDVHTYRPERWIECTDSERSTMERASMAFSHGKRMCLGVHLAWAEMLKVVPELLRRFDIELEDPNFQPEWTMRFSRTLKSMPVKVTARS